MKTKKQLIRNTYALVAGAETTPEIEKALLFLANDIETLVRSEVSEQLFSIANKVSSDKI